MKSALLLALLALSACATLPDSEVAESVWGPQREKLQALDTWQLNAALAANSKDDGFDARLFWRQDGAVYRLRLNGPLGQGTVLIDGDSDGVRLRTGDNRQRQARDPETLLAELTDLTLPVSDLKYWIRGLPVPTLEIGLQRFHANGSLAVLEQDGWHIEFVQHHEQDGHYLPRKLELRNGEIFVKLVVSQWQL